VPTRALKLAVRRAGQPDESMECEWLWRWPAWPAAR
jgi:hypothetical protein